MSRGLSYNNRPGHDVRRGNCPTGKRPRWKCTPWKISYIILIDKSLPNFRPRKFVQKTSDSLSLIVGRYLIFARRSALKNVVGANRPWDETYSGRNVLLPLPCFHWSSVRDVWQVFVTAERSRSSNCVRIEWPQQGEERKTSWSLGPPKQYLRRMRASLALR